MTQEIDREFTVWLESLQFRNGLQVVQELILAGTLRRDELDRHRKRITKDKKEKK